MTRYTDYRLQIKVKNGPMLRAMEAVGIFTAAELGRQSSVGSGTIGEYLSLTKAPILQSGDWSEMVKRISKTLKALPEDLFPVQHQTTPLRNGTASLDVSLEDIKAISSSAASQNVKLPDARLLKDEALSHIYKQLHHLPAREERVLRLYYGVGDIEPQALREIGVSLGISGNRVRQIRDRALRRLRSRDRSHDLQECAMTLASDPESAEL